MLDHLNGLFDDVVSGREYDSAQVRDSANIASTMIKVLRFEFDVYKHFAANRMPGVDLTNGPPPTYQPRSDFVGVPTRKPNVD